MRFKILVMCFVFVLSFSLVSSFVIETTADGEDYYTSDLDVYVPSINVQELFVLEPSERPSFPRAGTMYFDREDDLLKFYDGDDWRIVSFAGDSKVSVVKKEISEDEDAEDERDRESEVEDEIIETGNESLVDLEVDSEEVENDSVDLEVEDEVDEEAEEVCSDVCEDVCEVEDVCEEKCEDVEECDEVCETDEEGNEECQDVCETKEECGDVCEDVESCEEICSEVCEIPAELFDIRMDLEETVLKNSSKLRAVVTYESFGRVPTPVDLIFEVFDEDGNSVYLKKGDIVVTVEEIRRYEFVDLDLGPGEYEFVFKTLYNVNVFDEFKQKFTIKKYGIFERWKNWIRGLF